MLEPILKGLIEWLYGMMVDIMAYMSGELIGVMSMDLAYFERTAPVIRDIVTVLTALGWALLIGNLVFQMVKAMMSGIGFEAEDPTITFLRTAVFAFLLSVSKEICAIGLGITNKVITLLQLPDSINIVTPDESMFTLGSGAKWLLVIIVGVVLMVQMLKLLFEIGERYVVCGVLTFFAPLAFSMGGSKNTNDIFKGWCRMYCSMLVMMIMNIVFLKLIMSAMAQMSSGGVLIWLVFVVALTRVARKIDSHIGKIGLNPAQTGNALGSRLPGVMTMMAVRAVSGSVSRSIAAGKSSTAARRGNDGKTLLPEICRQTEQEGKTVQNKIRRVRSRAVCIAAVRRKVRRICRVKRLKVRQVKVQGQKLRPERKDRTAQDRPFREVRQRTAKPRNPTGQIRAASGKKRNVTDRERRHLSLQVLKRGHITMQTGTVNTARSAVM